MYLIIFRTSTFFGLNKIGTVSQYLLFSLQQIASSHSEGIITLSTNNDTSVISDTSNWKYFNWDLKLSEYSVVTYLYKSYSRRPYSI